MPKVTERAVEAEVGQAWFPNALHIVLPPMAQWFAHFQLRFPNCHNKEV